MSSYIAVDLKAIETHAPAVARATEQPLTHVLGGLNLLWHRCWVNKSAHITRVGLAGIFGPSRLDELIASLIDSRFLEAEGDAFRVKGAEKYLRISEARSTAGKTRAESAKRTGGRFTSTHQQATSKTPAPHQQVTSTPPATDQQPTSTAPALTPSTEHRAPNTNKDSAPAPRTPRETDLLQEDFKAIVGTAYVWNGAKDGTAFAKLRKEVSLEEIRTRWKRGLRVTSGWLAVRTVAQLASKWNDLAAAPPNDLSGDWRSRVDHSKDFFAGVDS